MTPGTPEPFELSESAREGLLCRYAAGRQSRDLERLVISYRPLARALARRYMTASSTREDLEQVACEGLVKALQRYDPTRGAAFTSFAVPTILGELRRYVRDARWPAHVPRVLQERVRAVRLTAAARAAVTGRSPTVQELASALGWREEDVAEALEVTSSLTVVALDAPVREEGGDPVTVGDQVGAEDGAFEHVECLAALEQALPALPERQQRALRLHYGEDLTQRQIAARLGVPRTQVARDLDAAVTRLRAATGERVAA